MATEHFALPNTTQNTRWGIIFNRLRNNHGFFSILKSMKIMQLIKFKTFWEYFCHNTNCTELNGITFEYELGQQEFHTIFIRAWATIQFFVLFREEFYPKAIRVSIPFGNLRPNLSPNNRLRVVLNPWTVASSLRPSWVERISFY